MPESVLVVYLSVPESVLSVYLSVPESVLAVYLSHVMVVYLSPIQ